MYPLREKIAYSFVGKQVCRVIRAIAYPNERLHWVQQRIADLRFN